MKKKIIITVFLFLTFLQYGCIKKEPSVIPVIQQQESAIVTIHAVNQGTTCKTCGDECVTKYGVQGVGAWKCDYNLDNDLVFTLHGVGHFPKFVIGKSDGENGNYQILFFPNELCVVIRASDDLVKRNERIDPDYDAFYDRWAYISPANGMAFYNDEECESFTRKFFDLDKPRK